MVWDKTLPLGSKAGNLLDDDVRANNAALETAIDAEHTFASGGDQDGRHKFMVDSTSNIAGESEFVAGALALSDNTVSGYLVPLFYDGTDWWNPIQPFLHNANDWAKGQYVTPKALTPGATVASNWDDSNVFTLTLGNDPTELSNPTNLHAGKNAVRYYIITQSNPASVFDCGTYFNGGDDPVISDVNSSVNVLQCIQTGDSTIQASFMGRVATDAEALIGTEAGVALTPANLGQAHLTTWTKGYHNVVGTGADGTGLVEQWVVLADVEDGASVAFEKDFETENYALAIAIEHSVIGTGEVRVDSGTRVVGGFDLIVSGGPLDFVHVRAIGIIAAP